MRHNPRRSLALRRVSVAAVVAPLAISLAACGSDDDAARTSSDSSSVAPSDASSPTPEGDGEKSSAVGQQKPGEKLSAQQFADLLEAAFDQATTASISVSTEMPSLSTTSEGVVDYTGDSPRMAIEMEGGPLPEGSTARIRVLDDAIYMDTGMSGGKFYKVPEEQLSASQIDLSSIDPSDALRHFAAAADDVTYVGPEDVDGDELHHYSLTLDPAKMKLPAQAAGKAPEQIDYQAWFDDEGRIRRITTDMGDLGSTTLDYDKWGEPVTIEAPPAGEVMEMPQLPATPQG